MLDAERDGLGHGSLRGLGSSAVPFSHRGDKLNRTSIKIALRRGAGDSPEHRAITRAIAKAGGDREHAIKNVCRLYAVKNLEALPAHVRAMLR